jgi:hypothetical protein
MILLSSPSAPAAGSGAGKDAALVTNLRDKGVTAGRFLEDVLIERGERF